MNCWRWNCCRSVVRQRRQYTTTTKRKHALLFPGQGAQHVGMGKDVYNAYPVAKQVFDEAEEAIGGHCDLRTLMFEGPPQTLTLTENAQPAILLHSIALLRVLETEYGFDVRTCTYILGHSLGEYSALVAAKSLLLSDAIKLVRLRGLAMSECLSKTKRDETVMKAVIVTASLEEIESVFQRVQSQLPPGEVAEIANINSKSQIVLSGTAKGVDYATSILQMRRLVGRAIALPVSGPFHCSLMHPAAIRMKEAISKFTFNEPVAEVISNVTGKPFGNATEIPNLLVQQIFSPVQWLRCLTYACLDDVHDWICVGPTKVQANLIKKDFPTDFIMAVSTESDLKSVGPRIIMLLQVPDVGVYKIRNCTTPENASTYSISLFRLTSHSSTFSRNWPSSPMTWPLNYSDPRRV
ncbi:hypothetical protein SeMB42_g05278 [Synchytrium endobioticum]|uniref:[acyl-carrier-protein] S-malonyltransferase n=1 Tax=Synchytrium endobioticum TaxID=286115 RepID=A0A507CSI4_9FUNG|nr:hypothetical protein SeLEV6574_g05914 [Synchytrium endobioticum]TPX42132.1 hypothetical protein SeMB42_g05278 [Synchytrium endobioticum]